MLSVQKMFMVQKCGMRFLGGLNFGAGIFWGFDFCSHSIIPVTWSLEIRSTPLLPPPGRRSGSISFISCMNFYVSSWTKNGPKEYENIITLYLLLLAPPLYLQLLLPPSLP